MDEQEPLDPMIIVDLKEDDRFEELRRHVRRLAGARTGMATEVMDLISRELDRDRHKEDLSKRLSEWVAEVAFMSPRKGRYSDLYKKGWRKGKRRK